jgi:hypothetical protein
VNLPLQIATLDASIGRIAAIGRTAGMGGIAGVRRVVSPQGAV